MYRPHNQPDFKRQPKHLILKYFKGCLYTVRLESFHFFQTQLFLILETLLFE